MREQWAYTERRSIARVDMAIALVICIARDVAFYRLLPRQFHVTFCVA